MRSIISTSLMAALVLSAHVGPGWAGDVPEDCYERKYDAAHLARNPAQVVRQIMVWFDDSDGVSRAGVFVRSANQGHEKQPEDEHGAYEVSTLCEPSASAPGGTACAIECDGGNFEVISKDDKSLVIRTSYFMMGGGDSCGGIFDLAEVPGRVVSYKLNRAKPTVCSGRPG